MSSFEVVERVWNSSQGDELAEHKRAVFWRKREVQRFAKLTRKRPAFLKDRFEEVHFVNGTPPHSSAARGKMESTT